VLPLLGRHAVRIDRLHVPVTDTAHGAHGRSMRDWIWRVTTLIAI